MQNFPLFFNEKDQSQRRKKTGCISDTEKNLELVQSSNWGWGGVTSLKKLGTKTPKLPSYYTIRIWIMFGKKIAENDKFRGREI